MREALGSAVTMTTGLMNEIHVYADEAFDGYAAVLLSECSSRLDYDLIEQHFISPAEGGLTFDTSGRLLIRDQFRHEAKVDKDTDVVLVWRPSGWLEIWNRAEYNAFRANPAGYKRLNREILANMANPLAQDAGPRSEPDHIV